MIAEMLEAEMKKSEEFKRKSFGLQVGEGYRDMLLECIANDKVAQALSLEYIMIVLQSRSLAGALDAAKDPGDLSRENAQVSEQPMKYLFWGLQIGRELERQKNVKLWEEAKA